MVTRRGNPYKRNKQNCTKNYRKSWSRQHSTAVTCLSKHVHVSTRNLLRWLVLVFPSFKVLTTSPKSPSFHPFDSIYFKTIRNQLFDISQNFRTLFFTNFYLFRFSPPLSDIFSPSVSCLPTIYQLINFPFYPNFDSFYKKKKISIFLWCLWNKLWVNLNFRQLKLLES